MRLQLGFRQTRIASARTLLYANKTAALPTAVSGQAVSPAVEKVDRRDIVKQDNHTIIRNDDSERFRRVTPLLSEQTQTQ